MQTWYQRHNVATNAVEWTTEPYIYWQPRDHFRLLSSIKSDQMPREEWFDRSGLGQAGYNPPSRHIL